MPVSRDEVAHVARLARLTLNDDETDKFTSQLSVILDYIDQLREVDTSSVHAASSAGGGATPLREDVAGLTFDRSVALGNAPDTDGTFFRVPKVIDG